MTTITPDLPDWTNESSAGTLYAQQGLIPGDSGADFGLSGIGSYLIQFSSDGPDSAVLMTINYNVPGLDLSGAGFVTVTAHESEFGPVDFWYESPSYGGSITMFNNDPDLPVTYNIVSSNRIVDQPRLLNDLNSGTVFEPEDTTFVNTVPKPLQPVAATINGCVINVVTAFTIDSDTNGTLMFYYRDARFNQRQLAIATVVAGVEVLATVPLPACIGQLYFVPSADNPTGHVTVQCYPAYSG